MLEAVLVECQFPWNRNFLLRWMKDCIYLTPPPPFFKNRICFFKPMSFFLFQFNFAGFYHGAVEELNCYARADACLQGFFGNRI